jgi:hypothetical protein
MKKRIFLASLVLFCSLAMIAQKLTPVVNYVTTNGDNDRNIIYYKDEQQLTWDDFKGKPVSESDAVALTNAGFGVKLAFRRVDNVSQLLIDVNCNFSKKDSWVKKGNNNPYILNHEQKHFDIAYLHTLMFIQKLKDADFTKDNYAAVIEKIYKENATLMAVKQSQYDAETSHSRNIEKQQIWDKKITDELISVNKK